MAYEEEPPSTLELLSIPFLLLLVFVLVLYAPFWAIDKLREKWRERRKTNRR
jgi:hypothetical protein